MTDISVIILVGQEKLHMRRCLEKLRGLNPRQIFVIESQPPDGTREIAESFGAKVIFHQWPGVHAKQFNWALDNLPIKSRWVLRLDADEYLYDGTCEEVKALVGTEERRGTLPEDVSSLSINRTRVFCGRRIRYGGTALVPMTRIFRYGIGRCEDRAMDEHIVTSSGKDMLIQGAFADDNLNPMDWWREKHRGYAKREARDALAFYRGEITFNPSKAAYYRWPPYLRAVIYFCIRYFLRGGFLDGYAGWMWNFWQGLWYRWIVDCEIARLKELG